MVSTVDADITVGSMRSTFCSSAARRSGRGVPADRGGLVRCVLESLALEYNRRLDAIAEIIGRRPATVYMVGGGIRNKLLCQLTADACGVRVHAGADQCTALGNALGQALALGILGEPKDIRRVMRNSSQVTTYDPAEQGRWAEKRQRYAACSGK